MSSQAQFPRSLRQQVVNALGGEIVRGVIQPGESLPPEDVLLARYGVSRTVLREAIHVLCGKGLLNARPKRGTVVRPHADWNQLDPSVLSWRESYEMTTGDDSWSNLDHLMEMRRIIEPSSAALAAQRATPEDLARIRCAYSAMEDTAGGEAEPFREADLAFHIACLYAAHNDFLLPVANAIRTAMMQSLRITNRSPQRNRVSLTLHRDILEAIEHRDLDGAAMYMKRHLDDTEVRRRAAARQPPDDIQTTQKET
jgi:DNA-binding FadR family transcriptional regulator